MLLLLSLAAALHGASQVPAAPRADTARARGDTATTARSVNIGPRGTKPRVASARDSASAWRDPQARALIAAARAARERQDSALVSYDAMSYGRVSAGMSLTAKGRDRLIFRMESAARVRWNRAQGVWVDVEGHRTVLPIVPKDAEDEARQEIINDAGDMSAIPYFPGSETLWIGGPQAERATKRGDGDGVELVHPLGRNAEAYYTYETGDSASFRLPSGRSVRIREVRVRPREAAWNVVVGSLWFDADRGTLVRAAYRMGEPLDLWVTAKDEIGEEEDAKWVKRLMSPFKAEVRAIVVEYGLHEGRFWLPRLQYAEGAAQVGFMHVPFRMEQTFRYASVNGADSIPTIRITERDSARRMPALDSMTVEQRRAWRDSVRAAARVADQARADSVKAGTRKRYRTACDTSTTGYIVRSGYRYGDTKLPVAEKVPCDVERLATSKELPASIYDAGEEVFSSADRENLIQQALTLGAQPGWGMQPPTVNWGLPWLRYNRVEGPSVGAQVVQDFGAGYSASLTARLGFADLNPNVELFGQRSDLSRTVRVGGYHRLVPVGDRGDPLSLGSSLSALLWGRDEGFYYRATGAEVGWQRERGSTLDLRAFVERQGTADVKSDWALIGGMTVPWNVRAAGGTYAGGALRWDGSRGLDPLGFRLLGDVRLEGATRADSGGAGYGRASADLTLSHGLGRWVGHQAVGAATLAGGSSLGTLPAQRWWYLGGLQTVRGQAPGAAVGDAYWLGRAELGWEFGIVRPTLFGDVGWAGDRRKLGEIGRPLSGVGAGASFMDGMIRLDVARGINPGKQLRIDLSLESRF